VSDIVDSKTERGIEMRSEAAEGAILKKDFRGPMIFFDAVRHMLWLSIPFV